MRQAGSRSGRFRTGSTRPSSQTATASTCSATRRSTRSRRSAHAHDEDRRSRPEIPCEVERCKLEAIPPATLRSPLQLGRTELRQRRPDPAFPVHEEETVGLLAEVIADADELSPPRNARLVRHESRSRCDGVEYDRLRKPEGPVRV